MGEEVKIYKHELMLARNTICLLNSMINGKEDHSEVSEKMVKDSLEYISDALNMEDVED